MNKNAEVCHCRSLAIETIAVCYEGLSIQFIHNYSSL